MFGVFGNGEGGGGGEADIKREGIRRVSLVEPALGDFTLLALVVQMRTDGMVSDPTPGSDMDTIRQIYVYAKQQIAAAPAWTESELEQYDAASDSGWPV